MKKILSYVQPAIIDETKKLMIAVILMTMFMWGGFYVFHRMYPIYVPFDVTVFLGGIGGGSVAVGNFFLMGISFQKIMESRHNIDAEKKGKEQNIQEQEVSLIRMKIKSSYVYRTLLQMLWVVLVILLPIFQTGAGIIPILFPGIWYKMGTLIHREVGCGWN